MESELHTPQGCFELKRLPARKRELLRAWDAADEYLLNHLAETRPAESSRLLIINDSFGALAVALNRFQPTAISDSWLSHTATRINLATNNLAEESVTLLTSLQSPEDLFDTVVIKVPKTLALLEDQLIRLWPHITVESKIILAGMVKGMPATVWKLVERRIGPTTTSLAKKKAKLIFASPDSELVLPENPYPSCYTLEGSDHHLCNHASVFSRERLDIGTRFFLQYLPVKVGASDIIDLGCGNGVVGLIAAERNPQATIHFVDESFMALASAEDNFSRAFPEREASYQAADGLTEFAPKSADLVLCNPPFHQQQAVGDQIAHLMFRESKRVLRSGGELWVVGNRHLGYHATLKRLFGSCELVASNKKFVILRALR